ncbi:hypothetical protein C8R42DRAFT_727418 [Lentinula raphanica]|nr:hypothetical protein C8R42DRAFT_727418 [Lentinula raphanica]
MSTIGNNRSTAGSTTNRRSMSSIPMPNMQASLLSNTAQAKSTSSRQLSTPAGSGHGKRVTNDVSTNSNSLSTSNSTPTANKLTANNLIASVALYQGQGTHRPSLRTNVLSLTESPTPVSFSNDMSTHLVATPTPSPSRTRMLSTPGTIGSAIKAAKTTPTASPTISLTSPHI